MEEELLDIEAEPLEADEELLETDGDELLVEGLCCADAVLLEEPEERLAWEYESAGNATMAIATIDAIAML